MQDNTQLGLIVEIARQLATTPHGTVLSIVWILKLPAIAREFS